MNSRTQETRYPRIPYGEADFQRIRLNQWLYVDKTGFIRALENERYAVLVRPRRFGKSCWVSLLENYYDRRWAEDFDAVFDGTEIGGQPTAERSRYVTLRFDFSAFDDTLETLRERFETYCLIELRHALERHPDLFPKPALNRILSHPSIDAKLRELFLYASERGIPLYALIDEYDNFANTVLAQRGREAYQSITHGGGFYRNFFAALKAGAGKTGGGLERLFITGVSPVTLDDVTSGFNIGVNLSLEPEFNEILGFTEAEVRNLLEVYRRCGAINADVEGTLALMREWYNGYRFAKGSGERLYNTDMVLYFLKKAISGQALPDDMIDANVRIDYGKLRHLLVANQRLNGNFDLLRRLIGEGGVESDISPGFPLEQLDQPENFLSLLHYFGLLSIQGAPRGRPMLGIPNQTIKRLMYGYLRDAYRDLGLFSISQHEFSRLAVGMAYEGAWRPALEFIAEAIAAQTGIRDYIDGEKVVHAFIAAHFSLVDQFLIHSESELNKGYADLHLEPFTAKHPDIAFGYVIELKYIKRGEAFDGSAVTAKLQGAKAQVRRYLADGSLPRRHPTTQYIGLAVVFHGWEMVACEALEVVA